MRILWTIPGVALILLVLWDAFETVVLPRRVTRRFRLTRFFYRNTWRIWAGVFSSLSKGKRLETYLGYFGPLSLLLLLSIWAVGLIFGFALLSWGAGFAIKTPDVTAGLGTYLYLSGTTFFTLGLGDVTPISPFSKFLTVVEGGMGFGLLALVIGYLPALNQSFSRREVNISLQDARAGSPPTAAGMLRRGCSQEGVETLLKHLGEWERWCAELLESHLSYPVLAYFRSQHDNQSWLATLTAILDTSAFAMTAIGGSCARQAELTFAMARHTVVDLSLVFRQKPLRSKRERLTPAELADLLRELKEGGFPLSEAGGVEEGLTELRAMYEPYVLSLSRYFRLKVPQWIPEAGHRDNWQTSAWERTRATREEEKTEEREEEHF